MAVPYGQLCNFCRQLGPGGAQRQQQPHLQGGGRGQRRPPEKGGHHPVGLHQAGFRNLQVKFDNLSLP